MQDAWINGSNEKLEITVPKKTNEWTITLNFNKMINGLEAYGSISIWHMVKANCDGTTCTFTNENWEGLQQAGDMLRLTYQTQYDDASGNPDSYPKLVSFTFNDSPCNEKMSHPTEASTEAPVVESTEAQTDAQNKGIFNHEYHEFHFKHIKNFFKFFGQ